MHAIEQWLGQATGFLWSWPAGQIGASWWPDGLSLLVLLCLGGGLFLTVRLGFIQFRGFGHAWKVLLGKYDHANEPGDISHLQALSTAVSATVGLGNIAGVAIAVKIGGPGAVFWMWVVGIVGMATKFTECGLATHFRKKLPDGTLRGGPMYYIVEGLGARWQWLATFFAAACMISSFGIGNLFQSNQAAQVIQDYFHIPVVVSGGVLALLLGLVIIGGIKRIGQVAGVLVPVMCIGYVLGALAICLMHFGDWLGVMGLVFRDAFALQPLAGGSLGAIIIVGVRRALFSSEAGFGSAPMAHAAAKTDLGMRQGVVALLEPFIDTIIVCSATASVILLSGLWQTSTADGVTLTAQAFAHFMPFGSEFVAIAAGLFAFSTAIAWSYYGVVSTNYLFGARAEIFYKLAFVLAFFVGAIWELGPIVNFSDLANVFMFLPNMIVILLLSGKAATLSRDYFTRLDRGEFDQAA